MKTKCAFYMIARIQRQTEVKRGDGLKGTNSYAERGCFHCQGYNFKCQSYYASGLTREDENKRKGLGRKLN